MKKKLVSMFLLVALTTASTLGVTFTWDANNPAEQVTAYRVYQATGAAGSFAQVADVGLATSYTVALTPGVYRFYVVAANFWGESAPSVIIGTPGQPSAPAARTLYVIVGGKTNTVIPLNQ